MNTGSGGKRGSCRCFFEREPSMERYKILYEDQDVLVIHKYPGLAVQSARSMTPDLVSMLRNRALEQGEAKPYLGLVNRLDQPVEGILLVGKNEKAAAELSRQVSDHIHMEKWYLAIVRGKLPGEKGHLVDYLLKDGKTNMSGVVKEGTKGSKRSELEYEVMWEREDRSLVRVHLLTGRHHQIRVQLAHAGTPIVGDTKYGEGAVPEKRGEQLCLCSYRTSFIHPRTKKRMEFQVEPGFAALPITP